MPAAAVNAELPSTPHHHMDSPTPAGPTRVFGGERLPQYSRYRRFRAGLPQGSPLAPLLFTLWSAGLLEKLRGFQGLSVRRQRKTELKRRHLRAQGPRKRAEDAMTY